MVALVAVTIVVSFPVSALVTLSVVVVIQLTVVESHDWTVVLTAATQYFTNVCTTVALQQRGIRRHRTPPSCCLLGLLLIGVIAPRLVRL